MKKIKQNQKQNKKNNRKSTTETNIQKNRVILLMTKLKKVLEKYENKVTIHLLSVSQLAMTCPDNDAALTVGDTRGLACYCHEGAADPFQSKLKSLVIEGKSKLNV